MSDKVKIEKMDRQACSLLQDTLREMLPDIVKELFENVDVRVGSGSYDNRASTKVRLEFTLKKIGGKDARREYWNGLCDLYDMKKADFGAEFWHNGRNYKITGLRDGRSRYCIELQRGDGKVVFGHPEMVRAALALTNGKKGRAA